MRSPIFQVIRNVSDSNYIPFKHRKNFPLVINNNVSFVRQ